MSKKENKEVNSDKVKKKKLAQALRENLLRRKSSDKNDR